MSHVALLNAASSLELMSLLLTHVLVCDPVLTSLSSASDQLVFVVFMQLVLTHLLDCWLPELVFDKKLDPQVLILDLTKCILGEFTIVSITENLTYRGVWNRWVFHLHDCNNLRPIFGIGVGTHGNSEVDLFVEIK